MIAAIDIISSCQKLSRVEGYFDKDLKDDCLVLVLVFDSLFMSIEVLEDDSLNVGVSANKHMYENLAERDLGNTVPWSRCIGKPIRWFWTMENNQGYFDGVQFEFAENVSDQECIVQIVAIASRLDARSVTRLTMA